MKNLAHNASFHAKGKIAPSKPGIKHLDVPCRIVWIVDNDLPGDVMADRMNEVAHRLTRFTENLAVPGQMVTSTVLAGDPDEAILDQAILDQAEAHDATLVVLGLHRSRPFLDLFRDTTMVRQGRALNYDEDFESCLTLVETVRTDKRDEKAKKAIEDGINAQSEVVTFGPDFWKEVLAWGRDRKRLTPKDQQILEVCVSMPRRVPSDLQSRHTLDVLGRMRDQGFGDV